MYEYFDKIVLVMAGAFTIYAIGAGIYYHDPWYILNLIVPGIMFLK